MTRINKGTRPLISPSTSILILGVGTSLSSADTSGANIPTLRSAELVKESHVA